MVSLSCANSPSAYASYDVLVHQLADLLAASSRQALTGLPLPFASSYHLIAILIAKDGDLPTEDFHLISSCPCWAYTNGLETKRALRRQNRPWKHHVGLLVQKKGASRHSLGWDLFSRCHHPRSNNTLHI